MSAIRSIAWGMVRRQRLALLVLAVVGGLGIGLAMTAASGARRADTSYTRLRQATLAPHVLFDGTDLDAQDVGALSRLPEVTSVARFSYTPVAPSPLVPGVDAGAFVGLDPEFLQGVYRPLVLRGRLADPDAGDEVVINEALAKLGGLKPGQRVQLVGGFDSPAPIGDATIVGVVRGTFDVGANSGSPSMLLSERFLEQHRDDLEVGPQPATLVRLVGGEADLPAFQRHASDAVGHEVVVQFTGDDEATAINRTLGVQTVGLGILAVVASIGTLAAIAQALSRLLDGALAELPTLVAMGVEPRQRLTLGGLLALPIALFGAVFAAAVAFLASPLIPTGLARAVDPARGHRLDLTVVVATATLWIVALAGAGVAAAWRHRVVPDRHRPEGRARRLLRPLPPRVRLGCEAALTPLNRAGGAASRSAMMAFVVSVAGVTAIATFGASLDHLLAAPALQGWSFDAVIVNGETDLDSLRESLAPLSQDSAVREVAWAAVVDIAIKGTMVEAYAFDPDAGNLHPTMRSGRPPRAEDEIALGADIMRGLGASLGDTVEISGPTGRERLTIVGSATYPELGNNGDLGTAVSLTRAAAQRVGAPEHGGGALIRLRAGQSPAALEAYGDVGEIITPFPPARVRNLRQIGQLPWLLVALASTLGVLAFAHGLWVSIRGRRRDLAVLASIGFRRRDIRAMHLWQASCIAAIGAVAGVAAGVVVGMTAWSTVATATAVVDRHVVPALVLLLIAGVSFLACNLIAVAETSRARRTTIAEGLRGE